MTSIRARAQGPSGSALGTLRRAKWELRTIVASNPVACRLLIRRSGYPVARKTRILIDGFPRSGTNFAVTAFLLAQGEDVPIAHHVHAPGHVVEAVRRGLPAVVLIRRPEDAILSFVVRLPHLTIRQALRSYRRFYRPLLPYRDSFVTAPFDVVVGDFGAVIRDVNERFGTAFREFAHTEENVRRCLDIIAETDRANFGRGEGFDRGAAVPSQNRERLKAPLAETYRSHGLDASRRAAESLYRTFTAGPTTRPGGS